MKILFRADSSIQMGTGHLMRCLTLADSLRESGHLTYFVCRDLPGFSEDSVIGRGHSLYTLPDCSFVTDKKADVGNTPHSAWLPCSQVEDCQQTIEITSGLEPFDWIVVDHYALDSIWEDSIRRYTKRLFAIDDLADRRHICDLLLDQNYYPDVEKRYKNLIPDYCQTLLGPRYVLLRPDFFYERQKLRGNVEKIEHVNIFFGGADPGNETMRALEAIGDIDRQNITVDVVIGSANPNKQGIYRKAAQMNRVSCHENVIEMAKLLAKADLAIGAGGTSTWERCCLGVPSLIKSIARNQDENVEHLSAKQICVRYDHYKDTPPTDLKEILKEMLSSLDLMNTLRRNSLNLVDGKGVWRIINEMSNL